MLRPRANYANNINYNCNAHRVITSGSVDPKVKKKKKRLFFVSVQQMDVLSFNS